jgi:hypothetical protein
MARQNVFQLKITFPVEAKSREPLRPIEGAISSHPRERGGVDLTIVWPSAAARPTRTRRDSSW